MKRVGIFVSGFSTMPLQVFKPVVVFKPTKPEDLLVLLIMLISPGNKLNAVTMIWVPDSSSLLWIICEKAVYTILWRNRGPFKNTQGRLHAWCRKISSHKKKKTNKQTNKQNTPTWDLKLLKLPRPFLICQLCVNLIKVYLNSIFTGKFVVIFAKPPYKWVELSRALFASGPSIKRLWTGHSHGLEFGGGRAKGGLEF